MDMMQAKKDKAKSKKKDKGKANSQTSQPCEVEADEPQALEDAPAEPLRLPMKKKRCMKAKTHNEVVDESTATPLKTVKKNLVDGQEEVKKHGRGESVATVSPTTVKKNLVDTAAVEKWSKTSRLEPLGQDHEGPEQERHQAQVHVQSIS